MGFYERYGKRALDVLISLTAILVLWPIYLIIAILVRVEMGSPVLFGQERIGKDEKPFRLYKFRSMTDKKDANGNLLPESERLTRFGAALRSSSLDELPELFNILKGDMALIGPRPLPTYYGPYFHEDERVRHSVRGGLIPPDSLSGKAVTGWEEQFEYECYYARHISLWLDIKVFFTTFRILLGRVETDYGDGTGGRPHLSEYRKDEVKN